MNFPIPVNLTVAQNNVPVNITVSDNSESIGLDIETPIVTSTVSDYDGEYDVTPSSVEQVFATNGKKMNHDFVVEPIPSNYGLITWNGSIITVS